LTRQHKQQLNEYRENTIINFDSLNSDVQLLDIDNVFSDDNLGRSNQFSNDVFASSEKCSKEFVEFSHSIIRSSTELLKGCQVEPPCNFAVVALGSVARGEATPYSDLEYAVLIENENGREYFTQLAIDTYFRITNLNESPLKTFNIKVENSLGCLSKNCSVGYRIDGLTPNAGNIPTGNGLGRSLIFTVKQAIKLYKEEVMSSCKELASLSDLFMTSQLIYCSEDGAQLHDKFMEEVATYEKFTAQNDYEIKQKRIKRLSLDLQKYDFLPEFSFKSAGEDVKVKEHIFRYITLLATNLNIALCFQLNFPWKVYEVLHQSGIISKKSLRYLHIILGLSIYMRTMAYITMGTQKAEILLSTPTADMKNGNKKNAHYYVPKQIFVMFGSILIPIKQSLILSMRHGHRLLSALNEKSVSEYLKSVIPSDLVTDKNDYMTTCEVLCYVEDLNTALKCISAGSGVDIRSVGYEEFVKHIRAKYNTNKSDYLEQKYLKMCCYLLITSDCDDSAIEYLSWLISYEKSCHGVMLYKKLIADCMNRLSRYKSARSILIQIKFALEEELMIKETNKSLTEYILRKVEVSTNLPESVLNLFQFTSDLLHSLGVTNTHLSNLAEAEYYLMQSLTMHRVLCDKMFLHDASGHKLVESRILNSLGIVHENRSENSTALECFTKSLELIKSVYGEHANHFTIAISYGKIGDVHSELSNYDTALKFYTMSMEMMKAVYGEHTNHSTMAVTYNNIGDVQKYLGNYNRALEYYTKSVEMMKAVYGENANHSSIAVSYGNIGDVHKQLGNYDVALEFYIKSMEKKKDLYGEHTKHPSMAISYSKAGDVHTKLGNYDAALEHYTKSMEMLKAVHGEHTNHSSIAISYGNIGNVHKQLGNYDTALEYYTKSLAMEKAVYGDHENHSSIAISYNNIGDVHKKLGNYDTALKYYTKSINMKKTVYGQHTNHPSIAICYGNIGNVHEQLGNYDTALEYYTKSLAMEKAVYGEHTVHPDIATGYGRIGAVHKHLGNCDTALEHYTKSIEMLKAAYGESSAHPNLADAISSIIGIYLEFNRYEDCLFLCDTPVVSNQCLSKVFNRISADYIRSSNYRRAAHFLQIAISKAADHSMEQAHNYHQMGRCYMLMSSYKNSWCWLYSALCLYQSFPKTREAILSLGEVHLSISHLLLHIGHVTQSLEHCQRSLENFNNLPDVNTNSSVIKHLKAEPLQLFDSLHLIKVLSNHF